MNADRTINRSVFVVTAAAVLFGGAGYALAETTHGAAAAKPVTKTVVQTVTKTVKVPVEVKPTASKPSVAIDLTLYGVSATGLSYVVGYGGHATQVYGFGDSDPSLGQFTPTDAAYPQDLWTEFLVDGVAQTGTDGGETTCVATAELVPVHDSLAAQKVTFHDLKTGTANRLATGTHTATWKVHFCAPGSTSTEDNQAFEKTITFTVS